MLINAFPAFMLELRTDLSNLLELARLSKFKRPFHRSHRWFQRIMRDLGDATPESGITILQVSTDFAELH